MKRLLDDNYSVDFKSNKKNIYFKENNMIKFFRKRKQTKWYLKALGSCLFNPDKANDLVEIKRRKKDSLISLVDRMSQFFFLRIINIHLAYTLGIILQRLCAWFKKNMLSLIKTILEIKLKFLNQPTGKSILGIK